MGAIATGGYSTARQFDCGALSVSGTSTYVSFNFTFTNIPKVVVNIAYNLSTTYVIVYTAYNVTTTGFTTSGRFWNGSFGIANDPITWIAIG